MSLGAAGHISFGDASENAMMGERDPYFGAQLPSENTLMEEFGFVPSKDGVVFSESADPSGEEIEEQRDGLVFHRNAFDILHQQYLLRGLCQQEIGYQPKPLKRRSIEPTKLEHHEKNNGFLPIDDHLRAEVNEMLCGMVPENCRTLPIETSPMKLAPFLDKDVEMQLPRHPDDLYTPRWVRGKGAEREGFCGMCHPGIWLKIKQSSYWYHMNFSHGISAATGRPYLAPRKIKQVLRATSAGEQVYQVEAKCDSCAEYICLAHMVEPRDEGRLFEDSSVRLTWWRHQQKCRSTEKTTSKVMRKGRGKKRKLHQGSI